MSDSVNNGIFIFVKLAIFLSFFVILHFFIKKLCRKFALKTKNQKKIGLEALFETAEFPLLCIIWTFALTFILSKVANYFELFDIAPIFSQIRYLLTILFVAGFGLRFKKRFQLLWLQNKSKDKIAQEKAKIDILGKLSTLFITVLASIFFLEALGFNAQTLATIGGLSGFSLGFAGKDVFSNFFGGLMIYITRPFTVGEIIKSTEKKFEGVVEDISWYYTTIRGSDKQPVYIPNSLFSNIFVTNLSRMTHWYIDEKICIRYQDIKSVEPIIEDIKRLIIDHKDIDEKESIRVNVDKLSTHSIEVSLSASTRFTKKDDAIKVKQQLLLSIADIVAEHNADFAYPTNNSTITIAEPIIIKNES
jgi:MscS family membrane protein